MKRLILLAIAAWCLAGTAPAQAQIFNIFRKAPPPPPPAQRVPQLIGIVKSDPDESKRISAVQELRDHDTKAFPDIVPILADVAKNDAKAGVRAEAINSLVRIRPISALAGQAIEKAAAGDETWKNRMSAQASLVRYRLAGYSSPPAPPQVPARTTSQPKNAPQSQEPPLNDAPPTKEDGPIYYYDSNGKQIPAPPNIDRPIIRVPAPTPTPSFAPPVLQPTPRTPQPTTTTAPIPAPTLLPPTAPNVSEPVFRAVNPPINAVPVVPSLTLTPPRPPVAIPPMPTAEPKLQGPSLDLPTIPNGPVLSPAPPQLVPTPPPALAPSTRVPVDDNPALLVPTPVNP